MKTVSATEAARRFSELLDGVEHHGEQYTIVRRGKPIAHLEPTSGRSGASVKELLTETSADSDWRRDLDTIRGLAELQDRP